MKIIHAIVITSGVSLLTACGGGGGGGGGGSITSTSTFNLLAAYQNLQSQGYVKQWTISGTCSGTETDTYSATKSGAVYAGKGAYSKNFTITVSYTNCSPSSQAQSGVGYFDINFMPLGSYVNGVQYNNFTSTNLLPTSVKVGDSGQLGNYLVYPQPSQYSIGASNTGNASWVIESDTATSAIVNLVIKRTDLSGITGSLVDNSYIEQDRYRINSDNTLTPVSTNISYTGKVFNLTLQ
jgi:hypothetical protein